MERVEHTRKSIGLFFTSLGLFGLTSCINTQGIEDPLANADTKQAEFTRKVEEILKPDNPIEILNGIFYIGPGINRRSWDQVIPYTLYFSGIKTNIAYNGRGEEILNPMLYYSMRADRNERWLVFFPNDRIDPVAVLVNQETDQGIVTQYGELGISKRINNFSEIVYLCTDTPPYRENSCLPKEEIGRIIK